MPPPNYEETELRIKPTVDSKAMAAGMKKATDAMGKHISSTTKVVHKLNNVYKKGVDSFTKWSRERSARASEELGNTKELLSLTKKLAQAEERLADATGAEADAIRDEQAQFEKDFKQRMKSVNDFTKSMLAAQKATKDLHAEEERSKADKLAEQAGYSGKKMGEDLAESFGEALSSIPSRDLFGFAKHVAKGITAAGMGLQGKGMRMQAAAIGGGGGAGMKAMGGVMKGVGSAMSMLAKMGPVISALSGALMAVVKIFLDADAAAKDFNKQVLETTGTAGYLAKNFGNADAAAEDLSDTMRDMYDQATSLDNLRWGISKETHAAVESALGAEGVQLEKVADYFEDIKKGAADATGYVKDWGSMVQMSVGFSRAFGVSLSEITSFQGEMMTEMGQNFDQVQASFQSMIDGAQDAGVGTNKFFSQIRAMSTDIGLFNLRMEDATKIMGKLDKVMNPRRAQEFFQSITGFMKGMGLMDRTKMTLLAGKGKTKDILQKDLAGRLDGLAADIDLKMGKGAASKIIKGGKLDTKNLYKWMAKNDKKLDANTRDYMLTAARQQGKLQAGGLIDMASALKDSSPMATMKMLDSVAQNFFKKPVDQLTDVQKLAFEQMTGFNDDQQDQFSKFKSSLDLTRETIAQKVEDGSALTEDEANMLKKLGIDTKGANAAEKLRATDSEKVFDNMNKTQQDSLRESAGTLDQAKRTGDLTQSITDKIGVIMDFLMREIYDVLMDIVDTVEGLWDSLPFGDKAAKEQKKMEIAVAKSRNRDLVEALKRSGGDMQKFRGDAVSKVLGPTLEKALSSSKAEYSKLADARGQEQDPEKIKDIDKRMQALFEAKSNDWKALTGILDATQQGNLLQDKNIGLSEEQISKIKEQIDAANDMGESIDLSTALQKAQVQLTEKQQDEMMKKSLWAMTPEQLANLHLSMPSVAGTGNVTSGPVAEAAAATPAAQTAQSVAQVAAAPTSTKPATSTDMQEATEEQGKNVQGAMDDLRLAMKRQSGGVVLNGSYLKNQYGGQIEDSVYGAASRALFEYWMYQSGDKDQAIEALKAGVNPRDMGAAFADQLKKGGGAGDAFKNIAGAAKPNAEGGVVGRPAPGEFFASVKPGETIVPAGGGGSTKVVIELKGDMLKQIMRATAHDAINDHHRAKRLR